MKKNYFPLLVIAPIIGWYLLFSLWPVINAVRTSFYEWNTIDPANSPFVGWRNYKELIGDPAFRTSFRNTFIYVILRTGIGIPLALAIAVLLSQIVKGRNAFIFIIFIPAVCAVAAMSVLFKWLYQPTFGLFNAILKALRLPPQGFLSDSKQVIYWIVATDIWQGLGYGVILFMAGIMEIPDVFKEAAKIDGASSWQVFWRITLPLLSNVTLFVVVTTLIGAFQVFDRIAVMTEGGPGKSSYVVAYFIYRYGIFHMRVSYATAAAIIMFLVILVFTVFQIKILRPKWEY